MKLALTVPFVHVGTGGPVPAGQFPGLAPRSATDHGSESLSSPESTSAQTIAFGLFASFAALAAIYISYRQLRAMRQRRKSAPTLKDPEDFALSDLRIPAVAYPYQEWGGGRTRRPSDEGYFFQLTRFQTVHQYVQLIRQSQRPRF